MIKIKTMENRVKVCDMTAGQFGTICDDIPNSGKIVMKVNDSLCVSLTGYTWTHVDFDVVLLENGTLLEICNND